MPVVVTLVSYAITTRSPAGVRAIALQDPLDQLATCLPSDPRVTVDPPGVEPAPEMKMVPFDATRPGDTDTFPGIRVDQCSGLSTASVRA
jgi:hypothetical protein